VLIDARGWTSDNYSSNEEHHGVCHYRPWQSGRRATLRKGGGQETGVIAALTKMIRVIFLLRSAISKWSRLSFVILGVLVFAETGLAQRRIFSLNEISELLKNGVSNNRIAQLVEEHGVGFELGDHAVRQLQRDGANEILFAAVRRASARYAEERLRQRRLAEEEVKRRQEAERRTAEQKRRIQDAKQQQQELLKRAEVEKRKREAAEAQEREAIARRDAEANEIKQAELGRNRALEEAKRKENEKLRVEEARRKAQEEQNRLEAERKKREQARRIEEARKQELDLATIKKAEEAKRRELNTRNPTAVAPPCSVGLRHVFQYQEGDQWTRRINRREGELCVIGRSYFNKDWTLVKQISEDGKEEITASRPDYPRVGEKWLPFPLAVGKEWRVNYRARVGAAAGVGSYANYFNVVSFERIDTRAGVFAAFKIRQEQRRGANAWGVRYYWYAPDVEYYVKRQNVPHESSRATWWVNVRNYELVQFVRQMK
jgi:hypothetical protein